MNRLIVVFMVLTLGAIVVEIARGEPSPAVAWISLPLAAAPILVAGLRTVPQAVRLGSRRDPVERQSELARSIGREHLFSLASVGAVLVLQAASA
jgi:hypothetical protein